MGNFLTDNGIAIILFFITTISSFGYFRARFDAKEKRDEEKFIELHSKIMEGDLSHEKHDKEQFIKFEKYSGEFYERINKLEVWQGAQNQFNLSINATLELIRSEIARTNSKLDVVEGLLRSRRFDDK